MAVVKFYIGPSSDGVSNNANTGLSRAQRVATIAQIKTLVAAMSGSDTARIMMEGVFYQGLSGWSVGGSNMVSLQSSDTNMNGVRLSATNTEDSAAPLPVICSYDTLGDVWTDTTTTTTLGTKIWSATTTGGVVRRLWAADWTSNSTWWKRELWEGGANYTTSFSAIHTNLDKIPGWDTYGTCWTCYNSAGSLATTTVYMASPVDPFDLYGTISYVTNEMNAVMVLAGIQFTVDPEITIRGGGSYSVSIYDCNIGSSLFEAAIEGTHPYQEVIGVEEDTTNLIIAPHIDPLYPVEVPYYPSTSTGHNVGSNHGVSIKATCNLSGTTSYATGVRIIAEASNGRRSRINDMFHAGVGQVSPTGGRVHKFVSIEPGVEFDFAKVKYGRAFAWGATRALASDFKVAGIMVFNQPTQSQGNGLRSRMERSFYHSKDNVGSGYTTPWGLAVTDKSGTSIGISTYSGTGVEIEDIEILDNIFYCQDGGWTVDAFNSIAIHGRVLAANNAVIRPGKPGLTNAILGTPRALGFSFNNATDAGMIQQINNVLVGFTGNCVRRFQTSPSVNDATTVELCLPSTQNIGWLNYDDEAAFRLARHAGLLTNLL